MKTGTWTSEELVAVAANKPLRELVKELGRTPEAIKSMRKNLRAGWKPAPPKPAISYSGDYREEQATFQSKHWEEEHKKLAGKYTRLQKENALTERLVSQISSLAPKSYDPAPPVTPRTYKNVGAAQSAVLMLSDTHVGQVIRPEQTLNFGEYNFNVFLARLKFLESAVTSILKDHTTTKVDELVVPILGDMIHGNLNHGAEAAQVNTLFSQFYGAGHAIAQFLRNLASQVPKVRIPAVVGNHPRWANQYKMATENRYSNLDMFLYAYIQALTVDIKNIEWALSTQPFAIFDIQGFIFHASHGDHLRGGDKALGIPNHALGRAISVTSQLFGKYETQAPNYYLLGHLHRGIEIPHATGTVMINGGFPGLDSYGLTESFNPVDPTQRFFLVHPKFGKTAAYEISLKFAEVAEKAPYTIPDGFEIK